MKITIDRDLVEQALEALEYHVEQTRPINRTNEAINALRAALAEPVQEPVAWRYKYSDGFWRFSNGSRVNGCDPIESQALYTAPPQRKPLTEEQIDELIKMNFGYITAWQGPFVRAIERAHGIGGNDE